MTKIELTNFKGEVPRIEPNLLPDGYAQIAKNTRLQRGHLAPQNGVETVFSFGADVRTIYLHKGVWLGWDDVANAVPGPVADDRLYITGVGEPKLRRPDGGIVQLKVPTPINAPKVLVTGIADDPDAISTILFAITFVTDLGEESAPSPISNPVDWSAGQGLTIDVDVLEDPGRGIERVRLYQSQTTSYGSTDLYFIVEAQYNKNISTSVYLGGTPPAEQSETSVYVPDSDTILQEPLASKDFDQPVDDLKGLVSLPNGMMAAFDGKTLFFCEPYQPHAWPQKYSLTTDYEIVGLASFGTDLAVLTTGTPYIAQGSAPENMLLQKLEQNYPCVSAAGIVDMGYAAAYPSHEGLVTISSSGAQLITKGLFTRSQWVKMKPETIDASLFDGRYVFSYIPIDTDIVSGLDPETFVKMGAIDITGSQPFYIQCNDKMVGLFQDILTGELFGITELRNAVKWDSVSADHMMLTWASANYSLHADTSFGAYFVEAESSAGTADQFSMSIYADGALIYTAETVNKIDRLPSGLHRNWKFEIQTNMTIKRVSIAGNPDEIGKSQ